MTALLQVGPVVARTIAGFAGSGTSMLMRDNSKCAGAVIAMLRGQISKRTCLEIIAGQMELPIR